MCRAGEGDRGQSLSGKYQKTVVEAVGRLDTVSKQADGWKVPLRAASCSTRRGPSLVRVS